LYSNQPTSQSDHTQWRSWWEASEGMRSVHALEAAHQHTLFRHLKHKFFSRNLGQKMPKNVHFSEKRL